MAANRFAIRDRDIVIPYHPAVHGALPYLNLDVEGRRYMGLPYKLEVARYLRNVGFRIPAPILHHYDWNDTTPFEAQKLSAAFFTFNKRAYNTSQIGTGKTRSAIYAYDYLRKVGAARRMLVVAPLSTLSFVWEREFFLAAPHLRVVVLHGSADKRRALLKQPADVYIINHEGLRVFSEIIRNNRNVKEARLYSDLADRKDIDVVLIDELAVFRNRSTQLWMAMHALLKGRTWAWGMTGAPIPKQPTDAWAQCRLLTPHTVPFSFNRFRSRVMNCVSEFRWLSKPNALQIVREVMQPAIRFTRDQCVDLPPTTVSEREVELSPEQRQAFQQMARHLVVEMQNRSISAANAGVKYSKLLQICTGFLYGQEKDLIHFDNKPRNKVLNELIDESEGKVILFTGFIEGVKILRKVVTHKHLVVDGSVSKINRDVIFNTFQNSSEHKVLIAHPKTMRHGLTLTAASTIIWYVPYMPDLDVTEQAEGRITRPGQTRYTHIIYLVGSRFERTVVQTLRDRGNLQSIFLGMVNKDTGLRLQDIL